MTDVQADYLKITHPELKQPLIDILGRISQFSHLSEEYLEQLFEYSKFQYMADAERPVQEGMYGQNIYILIQGRLEVSVNTESGDRKQIDVIFKTFSLFGEQCILGEPNSTTVETRGDVLLLAIDMSALPDLLEGWDNPDKRLPDEVYGQSLGMNTIFATVLINRFNRLIKDQYKLVQKLVILHQSREYQTTWKQNVLLTTLFNEFMQNQLLPELEVGIILEQVLADYLPDNEPLEKLIASASLNTETLYMELVRLESLGKIDSLNIILMETIQRLSIKAIELEEYTKGLETESHNLPAIISLPEYLNQVYDAIISTGILEKELSKNEFLNGFLSELGPDPSLLIGFLREGGWISNQFDMAYVMYLVCQNCIIKENELNLLIAKCVAYLTVLNTPRQNIQLAQLKRIEAEQEISKELIELYESCGNDESEKVKERAPEASPQNNVEDLLSEFGL